MDWLHTLLIAAFGWAIVAAIWFGHLPNIRRARRSSNGGPNMTWWVSFSIAVVLVAFLANQLPDSI